MVTVDKNTNYKKKILQNYQNTKHGLDLSCDACGNVLKIKESLRVQRETYKDHVKTKYQLYSLQV